MPDQIGEASKLASMQVTDIGHVVDGKGAVNKMVQEKTDQQDEQGIKVLSSANIQKYLDIEEEVQLMAK